LGVDLRPGIRAEREQGPARGRVYSTALILEYEAKSTLAPDAAAARRADPVGMTAKSIGAVVVVGGAIVVLNVLFLPELVASIDLPDLPELPRWLKKAFKWGKFVLLAVVALLVLIGELEKREKKKS
jgi:hypothetical protein